MLFITETLAQENKLRKYQNDVGILSLMYHRFDEFKYPSTNITEEQLDSHLNYLMEQNYRFIQASDLLEPNQLNEKTITVTIDDAYL